MTNSIHMIGAVAFAGAVMLAEAGAQLVEDHSIRLPTVLSVGLVVMGGAIHFSRRLQRIEDRVEEISDHMGKLWCQQPGRTPEDHHPGPSSIASTGKPSQEYEVK